MKKIIYLITILFTSTIPPTLLAQTTLTHAQVYNFEIGDVIQGRHTYRNIYPGLNNPSSYESQFILGKRFSSKKDTVYYSIKREYFTPKSCDTCFSSYTVDTVNQWFTQLTSLAEHYNETSQPPIQLKDSFYLLNNGSNRHIWAKFPITCDTCKNPKITLHKTMFIEGLGGPFYEKTSQNGQIFSEFTLIYYKKGTEIYGNFVASNKTIIPQNLFIKIYPNPASDQARIEIPNLKSDAMISIYSPDGKLCTQLRFNAGEINSFECRNLPQGLYLLEVNSGSSKIYSRFIAAPK